MAVQKYIFRKAEEKEILPIWQIVKEAIEKRRQEGSTQWQDGYPNVETIKNDLSNKNAYVVVINKEVIAYASIIKNDEPAYEEIKGKWLTTGDFMVVHRVAVANKAARQGIATYIFKEAERLVISKNVRSIKVDTNFDNVAMLHILEKLGYTYCGEVQMRGASRMAFEKVLYEA